MTRDPRTERDASNLMDAGLRARAWKVGRAWMAPPPTRTHRPRWWQRMVRAILAAL